MRIAALFLLVVCPIVTIAQDGRVSETVNVERILVDARVTDYRGEPILELKPADFTVLVDGRKAGVESVDWIPDTAAQRAIAGLDEDQPVVVGNADQQPAPKGRLLIFFFQTDFARNGVRIGGQMKVMPYADQIIDALEPDDRVAVFSFDSHLKFRLDFTSDPNRVRDAARQSLEIDEPLPPRLVPNPSLARRMDPKEMRDAKSSEESLILLGNALRSIPGPKSLVLFGWGLGKKTGNSISMTGAYMIARHVLEAARVSIFALDVTLADYHDLELGMQKAAGDTGGFYAKTYTFPQIAVDRLTKTLAGHYELEVRKPEGLRPGTHSIEVRVARKGTNVMARSSYIDSMP